MVAELTRLHSATSIFTLRYGLTYSDFHRNPFFDTFDLTSLGLPQNMKATATNLVFPRFAPEGFQEWGTEGYWLMDRQEGVHHISGQWSKVCRRAQHEDRRRTPLQPARLSAARLPSGRFAFGRGVTCADRFTCPGNQGNGLAAMLAGWTTGSKYQIEPKAFSRSKYMGLLRPGRLEAHPQAHAEPSACAMTSTCPAGKRSIATATGISMQQSSHQGHRLRHPRRDQVCGRESTVRPSTPT